MKHSLLILLVCLPLIMLKAQNNEQPKVTVYKPFQATETVDPEHVIPADLNCFKWNYWLVGRGVFALNYERALNKTLTCELGLGLTYRDWIWEDFKELGLDNDNFTDGIETNLGPYLEAGLRFYPNEDIFDGFYVSPLMRYRSYNLQSKAVGSDPSVDLGYNMTELGFTVGFVYDMSYWNVISDYYIGVSYVMSNYHKVDEKGTFHNNSPFVLLGWKIGWPF